ncbi:MAG TPA: hypothetical protein VIL79_03875, partial [Thermoleophilia bacterium]
VQVKIIEVDSERRRLSLSIKRVDGDNVKPLRPVAPPEPEIVEGDLEDALVEEAVDEAVEEAVVEAVAEEAAEEPVHEPELGLSDDVFPAGADDKAADDAAADAETPEA